MKRLMLECVCMIALLAIMQGKAQALDSPTFTLEKVIGNVYVGKQGAPLDPILGTGPGTYLTVSLYFWNDPIGYIDHTIGVLQGQP